MEKKMHKKEFEKILVKAFLSGEGGLYFEDEYSTCLQNSSVTLQTLAKDIKEDIKEDIEYCDFTTYRKCLDQSINTNQECVLFFNTYMGNDKGCYPELCGSIVGAMAKIGMFEEALEFIGINDKMLEFDWDT
jgi:hypothetical protein